MLSRLRCLLRSFLRRTQFDRELEDEVRFHLAARADDLQRAGLSREEAERRARLEFGGSARAWQEDARAAHSLRWPEELWQDVRYAFRTLRHSPGFTAVALLSLGLGIGANTTVFSVVEAMLLRPLPVHEPERLHTITDPDLSASYPNYLDLRDGSKTLEYVAGHRVSVLGLEVGGGTNRVWGMLVSGNYFEAIGAKAHLGRLITPAEDKVRGGSPYAVLSYACWRERFGSDPGILGRQVRINNLPYTIIGVAEQGFHGTEKYFWPEAWLPIAMQAQVEGRSWLDARGDNNMWMFARRKHGVTIEESQAELDVISARMRQDSPAYNAKLRFSLEPLGLGGNAGYKPMAAFSAGVLGLAALVMLAACTNLALLTLARTSDRQRELAIRLSIGAGRARVLRQLATEALTLAALGGALGCGIAYALLSLLSRWRLSADLPLQFEVMPDARVFLFAAAAALLSGLVFGLAPARQLWRTDTSGAMKGQVREGGGRRWAVRDLLLPIQVAICCTLVTSSFVAVRGMAQALRSNIAMAPEGVATVAFDQVLTRKPTREEGLKFQREAYEAIAHLPGVVSAAYSNSVPLSIDQSSTTVARESDVDFRPDQRVSTAYYRVSPGYFSTMATRLLHGREFTWQEERGRPCVTIVNSLLARRLFGKVDAIGQRVRQGSGKNSDICEVVGVVEDGKYSALNEQPRAALFWPTMQSYNSSTVLLVRTSLPEPVMAAQMREALRRLDSSLPVHQVGSLTEVLGLVLLPARAATVALSAFGLLAVMLAITGIYGVAAYAVARRTKEVGIRVAIGARPGQVLRFLLGRTALLTAAGALGGFAVSFAAGKALSSVVYHASVADPVVLTGAVVALLAIVLLATLAPARSALRIDPVRALRQE